MTTAAYLAIYCVLVILASLLGGWLPSILRLTHQRMQMMISVVAGFMLGIALFHLLPHAAEQLQSLDDAVLWAMAGLLVMFVLMRAFHPHHHHGPEEIDDAHSEHDHDHAACGHDHGAHLGRGTSWMGIAIGLSLHTLIDGVALGAAVTSENGPSEFGGLPGIGTFLAIALHKPLDALSITTLMASQGWSARAQQAVSFGYSLICPLGAALFVLGVNFLGATHNGVIGGALAFAAGVFLCIALADLLPEIEYHRHDRFKLSTALVAGVALAYVIGFVEPHHHHAGHSHADAPTVHGHDDHEHDHDHGHDADHR